MFVVLNSAVLPNTEHIRIVGLKDVPCLGTGRRSNPAAAVAAAGSDCSIGVVSATGSEKRRGRFCSHGRPAAEAAVSPTTTPTRPKRRMTRPNDGQLHDVGKDVSSLWLLRLC